MNRVEKGGSLPRSLRLRVTVPLPELETGDFRPSDPARPGGGGESECHGTWRRTYCRSDYGGCADAWRNVASSELPREGRSRRRALPRTWNCVPRKGRVVVMHAPSTIALESLPFTPQPRLANYLRGKLKSDTSRFRRGCWKLLNDSCDPAHVQINTSRPPRSGCSSCHVWFNVPRRITTTAVTQKSHFFAYLGLTEIYSEWFRIRKPLVPP